MIPKKIMLILLSVGLMVSFVMPWFVSVDFDVFDIKYLKPGNGISGYEVMKYENAIDDIPNVKEVKKLTGKRTPPAGYYLAFLIPALAVACIVTSVIGPGAWIMGIITGLAPVAAFMAMFVKFGADVPNHMTYGAFLTLACGISMVVASLTKS